MLTGQNAFAISEKAEPTKIIQALNKASDELKNHFKSIGKKIHLTTIKDFSSEEIDVFNIPEFKDYLKFSTQPNMTFPIRENWKKEQDYIDALSKKYRDQYKRTRKKAFGIEKRKMHLDEIIDNEALIYDLYFHVAENASFNTFFLAKNHFQIFKEKLKDKFLSN